LFKHGEGILKNMRLFCPILGRETSTEPTPYKRDQWKIVKCVETGFYFLADPPEYEMLESEYEWDKSYYEERERRKKEEPLYIGISEFSKRVRRLFTPPKRNKFYSIGKKIFAQSNSSQPYTMIDIGCGTGKLVEQLFERFLNDGIEVLPSGIEISDHLSGVAREVLQSLGGDIIHASAVDGASQCEEGSFDLVVMRSFLEHERRPLKLLQILKKSLTSCGAIIIKVPNFACWNRKVRGSKWCGFRYPDHVNYFTPKTMKILASEAGYSMESGFIDHFPLSDNVYVVIRPLN